MPITITPTYIVKTIVEIYNEQYPSTPVSSVQNPNDKRDYSFKHGEFVAFDATIIDGLQDIVPTFISLGGNTKQSQLLPLAEELNKRFSEKLQIILC